MVFLRFCLSFLVIFRITSWSMPFSDFSQDYKLSSLISLVSDFFLDWFSWIFANFPISVDYLASSLVYLQFELFDIFLSEKLWFYGRNNLQKKKTWNNAALESNNCFFFKTKREWKNKIEKFLKKKENFDFNQEVSWFLVNEPHS